MDTTEQALRDAVSLDNLKRHNVEIAEGVRLSGSADEAKAFAYLAAQCRSYRMAVEQYAIDAYVSLPGRASLAVASPEEQSLLCITHSFSHATVPEGLTAPLVYVGKGITETDYVGKEVRGAIVMTDGLAGPPAAVAGLDLVSNLVASGRYRAHLVTALTQRALRTAWERSTPRAGENRPN